jgi:molecular chaperone GrpE
MNETKIPEEGVSEQAQDEAGDLNAEVMQEGSPEGDSASLAAAKEEEIKQLQDRMLRMAAEMENTRKRLEREKSEAISFANVALIKDLLPVVDNLERALQHADGETESPVLVDGVKMTLKGFLDVLGRHGCVPFEAVGKSFDPNFHEAVAQQESAEHDEMTVLNEFQRGYTLNERLLRPAMVLVSKAPKEG